MPMARFPNACKDVAVKILQRQRLLLISFTYLFAWATLDCKVPSQHQKPFKQNLLVNLVFKVGTNHMVADNFILWLDSV